MEKIYPHQLEAVEAARELYEEGCKAVFLDGPTGSGKTLVGELVRKELEKRAVYVCTTKGLQAQFLGDFPYAELLKGRSNYPTLDMPFPEYTAAECTKVPQDYESCYWCEDYRLCPYEEAKKKALSAPLAVLNTAYFLTEANFVRTFSRKNQLAIVDECDLLENQLMGFVEFAIRQGMLKQLGLWAPKKGSHKPTIAKWMTEKLGPKVEEVLGEMPARSHDLQVIRRRAGLERLKADILRVAEELEDENWVRDNDAGPLVLKPVKVDRYGQGALWDHAERWLLMSATIISPDEMADSLGLEDEWGVVEMPMLFPVENRPIHVAPIANMTYQEQEAELPKLLTGIRKLVGRHEDERVLVHAVSYRLTKQIVEDLRRAYPRRAVVTYEEGAKRDQALEEYKRQEGAVMVAPSLDRGVDLKGDDCRVVIVAKMPFMSLGDRQVGARMKTPGGKTWYQVQVVRSLVQMTGRGVRDKEDRCQTYILDKQFTSNVWKKGRRLFPRWWREAVNTRFNWKELLEEG